MVTIPTTKKSWAAWKHSNLDVDFLRTWVGFSCLMWILFVDVKQHLAWILHQTLQVVLGKDAIPVSQDGSTYYIKEHELETWKLQKFLGDFVLAKVSNILKKKHPEDCRQVLADCGTGSHGSRCPGRRLGIPLNSGCFVLFGTDWFQNLTRYICIYIVKYHTVRDTNGLVNLYLIPSWKYSGLA